MEIRNPRTTGPSQDFVCTDHDDFGQEIRSYSCTFCNRGFSNAQALGGHMNVHRKDRARLQESIQDPLITTGMDHSMGQGEELQSSRDEKGEEGVPKRPWTSREVDYYGLESVRKKDDGGVDSKEPGLELSLCLESSSASDSYVFSNKMSSLSSSMTEVIDLELRLGMDSEARTRDRII